MNILPQNAKAKTNNLLHRLPLGSITAAGWLKEQLQRNKEGMGGHLDELEPDMIATPFINYSAFKSLPPENKPADPTFAAGWSSEISGCYWLGLVMLAFTLKDEELIAKATRWVDAVLAHQEEDGYLGGYPKHTDRLADYNAWSATWLYRALLSFYEATGREDIKEAIYKGLLWFCENWKDSKTDYVGSVLIEPMIVMFAYTGDERLVRFCKDYLDWLEENSTWQNKISQYLSDELPYGSMHVVAYGEDLKHPALVYCATGEQKLLDASLNAMEKAAKRIVQPTGGPSSCGEYLSPKGAACESEYCNFTTYNHTYAWFAMITGQAQWADRMELALFNAAEGARKKDEMAIAYMTAPNQLYANHRSTIYGVGPDMGTYSPCFRTACCPTQAIQIIPEFIRGMCMQDERGESYLFCYGPANVDAETIGFEMDTLYPFRDTVSLKITKAENHPFHVRIPGWCKAAKATVNGKEVTLTDAGNGFAALGSVNTGDEIVLTFPMELKLEKVDDHAAASKFPLCISRGPLVYSLPVPTKWIPYEGTPITPETNKDWPWFKCQPDLPLDVTNFQARINGSWTRAMDEKLDLSRIRVVEKEVSGYVWENPPISIEVPMYHAPYSQAATGMRTPETWEVPMKVQGDEVMSEMVPMGCTNLRITFIPRADV